ncbi:MAG: hypothetical protein AB1744_03190 [Candidatus Zixiibacteriota bacterium]
MDLFWQQLLIVLAVGLAVLYLAVRYRRRRDRKEGCTKCPTMKVLSEGRRSRVR